MTNKRNKGMVDISLKKITRRVAVAQATISMNKKTFHILQTEGSPKGNVFETARIAGIMAAKSTSRIIPLCHPLDLKKVDVHFQHAPDQAAVIITSEVICLGQTGVEMEALAAVSLAALTIYDMMKWADQEMVISDIRLLKKSGGKSGNFEKKR